MKIWVLFSVANMYDQPGNNLKAWWVQKPSLKKLALAIGTLQSNVNLKMIKDGYEKRINDVDYRMRLISEGKVEEYI